MEHYLLFLAVAAAAVLSSGPGVTLTITNSLRYGARDTFGGTLGIALGALIVAAVSATGAGLILVASSLAFTVMKYVGTAYLIYLGIKMWRSTPAAFNEGPMKRSNMKIRFFEGVSLQLSNPKAIFFFVSIFSQFIDSAASYSAQFFTFVLTYSCLVIAIHFIYTLLAGRTKKWFTSPAGSRVVNKAGGATLIFFGTVPATSNSRYELGE